MSVSLRVVLIVASVVTMFYMMRKIRKSQLKIDDSIFWIFFSIGLLVLSIFPVIADFFAHLFGIQSAVNFIFLTIIFVLLLKQFLMTVKISKLESKLQTLVQRLAVTEHTNIACKHDCSGAEGNTSIEGDLFKITSLEID